MFEILHKTRIGCIPAGALPGFVTIQRQEVMQSNAGNHVSGGKISGQRYDFNMRFNVAYSLRRKVCWWFTQSRPLYSMLKKCLMATTSKRQPCTCKRHVFCNCRLPTNHKRTRHAHYVSFKKIHRVCSDLSIITRRYIHKPRAILTNTVIHY